TEANARASIKEVFGLRDIFVVHSNVPKSTARAAAFEHGGRQEINRRLDRTFQYRALAAPCDLLGEFLREAFITSFEGGPEYLNSRWKAVCDLTSRVQGCLAALGFSFPVGDEILGSVARAFQEAPGAGSLGG